MMDDAKSEVEGTVKGLWCATSSGRSGNASWANWEAVQAQYVGMEEGAEAGGVDGARGPRDYQIQS